MFHFFEQENDKSKADNHNVNVLTLMFLRILCFAA